MMDALYSLDRSISAAAGKLRALLLREAIVLAEIPEKRVRKDIESGLLASPWVFKIGGDREGRLCTHWSRVFPLAAVYGNSLFNGRLRRVALEKVDNFSVWAVAGCAAANDCNRDWAIWTANICKPMTVEVDKYVSVSIEFDKVCASVKPRVSLYAEGLTRIEEKNDVIGGEAVFKKTRLSVAHIGKMRSRGETVQNILEDYPYLSPNDVEFAVLYYRANPPVGRPRLGVEANGDSPVAAG